ncbi:MAG: DNA methyltransferase, partial [Gallionella sp.]|nr:DNA methyltransferase [Gallionella sp.]
MPYDGSEVYLHWANKDQYYIKTTESFRQFSVDLAHVQAGDKQLFDDATPRKVHFTLVEAEEGAHNNVKAASDKDRYFILDADTPIQWQGDELTVRFHYRADPEKTGQAGKWREERNKLNNTAILAVLEKQAQGNDAQATLAQRFHHALATEIPKGKDGTQTLLAKYLNQYTAKNSMDYFIHKNLGAFLKRELDFYIKNELFRLDDLGNADAPNPQQLNKLLKKALTLRDVAHKLIEFLAQTEEFQKKLWLKKKFVVDTQWLVTLDKVPADFYPQIEANEAQWAEWVKLGFVAADAKHKKLLKPESKLVLDTQFFDADFTAQLLASIPNLDDATDGVLVHSENFQALNLMQARYREKVKCIYIDPPYNAKFSEVLYKNAYKHSSWMSMMHDRLRLSSALGKQENVHVIAIDENEQERLAGIIDLAFPMYSKTCVSVIHNPGGIQGKNFSYSNEFAYFIFPSTGVHIGTKTIEDANEVPLRDWGGDESTRESARNCFYPIFVKNGAVIDFGEVCPDDFHPKSNESQSDDIIAIYPIDSSGIERKWRNARNTVESIKASLIVKEKSGTKYVVRLKDEYRYKTVWDDAKYNSNIYGSKLLGDIQGEKIFAFPKSVYTVQDSVSAATFSEINATVLDYFAGSGTTGHAVINLNREDKDEGKRKYILVEMGDYFDTVLKPRIAKVVYSADWKDGKPTAPETGISQLVKVIRLESYEDTINNLQVAEESAQRKVIATNPALRQA